MMAKCPAIANRTMGLRRASRHAPAIVGAAIIMVASQSGPTGASKARTIAIDATKFRAMVAVTSRGPSERSPSTNQLKYGPYFAETAAGISAAW